jgi:ABC-type uncharacterized transport system permease subunit
MNRRKIACVLALSSLKTQIQYPFNLLGDLVFICLSLAVRFVFVEAVFENTSVLAGWNAKEMTLLAIAVSILGLGIDAFSSSISQAVNVSLQGNALPIFLRPGGAWIYIVFRWCKVAHVLLFVIGLFAFPLSASILGFNFTVGQAMMAMLALLFSAIICSLTLCYLIALSLWVQRFLPATYIFQQLFKFSQIPSTLLSQKNFGFLLIVPMFWVASLPTLVVLGRNSEIHFLVFISALAISTPVKFVTDKSLRASAQLGG